VCIGGAVGVYVLNGYIATGSLKGYSIAFGDFYLIVSKSIGTATVGITVYTIFLDERRWWQFLVISFLFIALALSLSRGALLFALIVVVLALFYALFRKPVNRSSIGGYLKSFGERAAGTGAIVVIGAALIAVALTVERTAVRLRRLIAGGGASVSERLFLWRASWERIEQAPILGHGLGSSGLLIAGDESTYPHNFLLQLWVDGGVGAVLLMLIIVSLPILAFLASDEKAGTVRLSLLGIYLYLVLDFSKSYNMYTGRLLFIFCALSISSFRKMEKT
jgi:O-antigen ligase